MWTSGGAGIQIPQPLLFSEQEALRLFPTAAPPSKNRVTEMVMGTGRNGCCHQLNDLLRHFNLCSICDSFKMASQMNAQTKMDLTKRLKG